MNSSLGFHKLEIALIELEYAAADFRHWKPSMMTETNDFGALLSKLMEANRAAQIALGIFARQYRSRELEHVA